MIGVCTCVYVCANMCVGGFMVGSGRVGREGGREEERDADGEESLNPQNTIQQQRK